MKWQMLKKPDTYMERRAEKLRHEFMKKCQYQEIQDF